MLHIAYSETVIATDERLGDLLLEYATRLARAGSADTVTIPGRIGTSAVEPVSILVGPASQITAWRDDEAFGEDVGEAVADLQRRLEGVGIPADGPVPPGGIDEFDELA